LILLIHKEPKNSKHDHGSAESAEMNDAMSFCAEIIRRSCHDTQLEENIGSYLAPPGSELRGACQRMKRSLC
jgi:hypothetical protein